MSEEEKEDIKDFKNFINYYYSRRPNYNEVVDEEVWNFERIVDLIEKQQKQNEELEKDVLYWKHQYEEQVKENEKLKRI